MSKDRKFQYCDAIANELRIEKKHNKRSVEKIAESFGIYNKNLIKEMTELAIVKVAREIASKTDITNYEKYLQIVDLYKNQVNLSHRTSQSMMFQQYSTPAPISYIASTYVRNSEPVHTNKMYFEPSAGNGLLTISIPYKNLIVNEIDDVRFENLKSQPFYEITSIDATKPFPEYFHKFDGILTNPPFGSLMDAVDYDSFPIKTLDHLMALRALDCMSDDGRAAIIIGGHTAWDEMGRIQAGKNRLFFNYLYSHYNVEDVILIDGHKLYSRQGTSFDVRLILINGRKPEISGASPLKNETLATVITDFDQLIERAIGKRPVDNTTKLKMKLKAKSIAMKNLTGVNDNYNQDIYSFFENKLNKPYINLGKPSKTLIDCGLSENEIVITKRTLSNKLVQHQLTIEHLLNLDKRINDPLLVFQSEQIGDAVLVIVEDYNHEGLLSIAIHIDVHVNYVINEVNKIASISGRRLSQLNLYLDDGGLLYKSDTKRIKDFFIGSQFNSAQSEKILSRIQRYKMN